MLRIIDHWLNSITMYRLVLYSLVVMTGLSFGLSLAGLLSFDVYSLGATLIVISVSCFVSNQVFSRLLKAATNVESAAITSLILFLIWFPSQAVAELQLAAAVAALAMASKYILAVHRKHIFNPAAIALVIMGWLGVGNGIWWIGSSVFLPVVAIIGLLVVRKLRRFHLFLSFGAVSLGTLLIYRLAANGDLLETLIEAVTSWPLLFFGTIMLTEPLTTPPHRKHQMLYGAVVGFLFSAQYHFGPIYSTPELALVLGNILSYLLGSRQKVWLTLTRMTPLAQNMYEFSFKPDRVLTFHPGQYMEWTLPHRQPDSRGNRRYFTIASSPTESEIKLGVRIEAEKASSFKTALLRLKAGDQIIGDQLSGDFCLPKEPQKKLVFIAGGIGVTPFRSMIQSLLDTKSKRDIVLYYSVSDPKELSYQAIFTQAVTECGLRYIPIVTKQELAPKSWTGLVGRLSTEQIQKDIPDFKTRYFYVSGPNAMVHSYQALLNTIGVPKRNIITDFFPGF